MWATSLSEASGKGPGRGQSGSAQAHPWELHPRGCMATALLWLRLLRLLLQRPEAPRGPPGPQRVPQIDGQGGRGLCTSRR